MATNLTNVRRGYADLNGNLQMYFETMGDGEPVIFLHQSWWSSFEFEKVNYSHLLTHLRLVNEVGAFSSPRINATRQ